MPKKEKIIIGKTDMADLPSFSLEDVKVKIDSGAYTSTIHCSKIAESEDGLHVVFLEKGEKGFNGIKHLFEQYELKKVRSSSGELQERYIIKGDILLFGKKYQTEFTLSNRKLMKYPVLLGRKLLASRFLIDTAKINLSFKNKNK